MKTLKVSNRTRVLLFERDADMREKLREYLSERPDIEITASTDDPRAFAAKACPDVVVTDLRDGTGAFLARAADAAVPVVAFAGDGAPDERVPQAGIFDIVARPSDSDSESLRTAFRKLVFAIRRARLASPSSDLAQDTHARAPDAPIDLIVMGASAGGTEAILDVLSALPDAAPPILIVQHITRGFPEIFAEHIDRRSPLRAKIAQDGEIAQPGFAYVAPDDRHLTVERRGGQYELRCALGERISGHMPSIDALFFSAAAQAGDRALGVLLTGMGRDGAEGLKRMRDAGAPTIGQDKDTSCVYGMPRAAYEMGGVAKQMPLDRIGRELIKYIRKGDCENGKNTGRR